MIQYLQKFLKTVSAFGLLLGTSFIVNKLLNKVKNINLSKTQFNIKHTIFLRPNTSDANVLMQVFVYREYDIYLGFEPMTIIDGGANIGLASIYFRSKFPKAKIISIEPDDENLELLKTNLANYNDIYIRQASIWSKRAYTRLIDKHNLGKWAMVTEELNSQNEEDSTNNINTLTIDDIMKEFDLEYIDVLKLDIESAEKQLFSNNYMNWLPKTKVIIIELHDWMTEGCSKPFFLAINNAFSSYNFSQVGENTVIINRDLVPFKNNSLAG